MQDLYSQIQRQFTIPPPPCEPEYRQDRELLQPVKRMLFPFYGRRVAIIGVAAFNREMEMEYFSRMKDDDFPIMLTIPKEKAETPAMDRAKMQVKPVELLANDYHPLAKFEDESRKETYHRKNIIEKRRRKR